MPILQEMLEKQQYGTLVKYVCLVHVQERKKERKRQCKTTCSRWSNFQNANVILTSYNNKKKKKPRLTLSYISDTMLSFAFGFTSENGSEQIQRTTFVHFFIFLFFWQTNIILFLIWGWNITWKLPIAGSASKDMNEKHKCPLAYWNVVE